MNQRGVIHLFLIVLLIVGIGVGIYLVKQTQIFSPQAAQPIAEQVINPFGSTPFSEISNYPKPSNGIQTMVYFIFTAATLASDKPYLNYLASSIDYVWFDQSSLATCPTSTTCTFENMTVVTNKLKELSPKIKTGVHAGAAGGAAFYHMIYPYLNDTDFLHKPDGTILNYGGDTRVNAINLSSQITRQKIAEGWKQVFQNNPALNGINIDGYISYAGWYPGGCREGDCNSEVFWIPALFDLSNKIKNTNPSKDITYNGVALTNTSYGGEMNILPVQYHNGILSEWAHEMLVSSDNFKRYLNALTQLANQGKKVFFWVQPEVFHHSYGNNFLETNNIPVDINLERFYLATYLLFQKNPYTYFGYSPHTVYDGNNGIYWYKDWNLDYGDPVGNWIEPVPNYYVRAYTNGYSVVNMSGHGQAFGVPQDSIYREWDPSTGLVVSGNLNIPDRTGKFFFKKKPLEAKYEVVESPGWIVGESQQFQVKVTNLGTETWFKKDANTSNGRFDLAAYIGPDDDWTHAQVASLTLLSSDLPPGGVQTLSVKLNAPSMAGNYKIRLRMVKQGYFWFEPVFTKEIIVNQESSPSVSTLPSVEPSRISNKVGDLDNDGDVDIFDFNLFLQDYKNGNLRSDLNNDGKVDIFDFNVLLKNFGK